MKMKNKEINEKLKYAIPFLVFILILIFALACGGVKPSEKEISETKPKEKYQELEIGQEFIYEGKKIMLTKYDILECATLSDQGEKELSIYLYVENTENVSRHHIYSFDFELYHKGRKATGFLPDSICNGRKFYDTGDYAELYPGEICEGWIGAIIPLDWKPGDLEIHLEDPIFGTHCIWKLK